MEKPKAYMNWSGGKDSTLALYNILQSEEFDVAALVTTVNEQYRRISMHGVRESLLEQQAQAIGIPLHKIIVPDSPSMPAYEAAMERGIRPLLQHGMHHSIFGDIFLEDLRAYRENKLDEIGVTGVFPLWKQDSRTLIETFIDLGFKTIVVCTQADKLDASFAGRVIDREFLNDLPADVDPCGENGEFHTFVFDGPIFRSPIPFTVGEKVFRTYATPATNDDACRINTKPAVSGFHYVDLL